MPHPNGPFSKNDWAGDERLMLITSLGNSRIKLIRKLKDRKTRQEEGVFLVEGLRLVTEAVQLKRKVLTIVFSRELLKSDKGLSLVDQQSKEGVEVLEVNGAVFESIASKENPQGIIAILNQVFVPLSGISMVENDLYVALEAVADPGNLGTILRTSDAVGAKGVILLDQSTDPYDPTSIRASMGAVLSQKLIKTTYQEFLNWKRAQDVPVVGTWDSGAVDYQAYHYPGRMVLLMGSERQGMSEPYKALCDAIVKVPMVGRSDSLNLAVATGVCLYEIYNQKRIPQPERGKK
jgi:TrmH family RNA methyltransferase